MKKLIALFVGVVFVAGLSGAALAQTQGTMPKDDAKKSMDKPASKPTAHHASGTVKTAASDNLVVAGKAKGKETEWTFSVDPKTKIRKAGKDITAADLAAGDAVNVRYHEDNGKNVADSVIVRTARKADTAAKSDTKSDTTKK